MALTSADKKEVEKLVRADIRKFLNTSQAHKIVVDIVKKEMGTRDINQKVVDLSTKVVVELFKTLWQRKSFWETSIKRVK